MMHPERVFLNASTVKLSGGLYITVDIISALLQAEGYRFHLVCPDIISFRKFNTDSVVDHVPSLLFHYLFRPLLDYRWLPRKIDKFNPDRVISFSNLPARTRRYQIFYHDNGFISHPGLSGFRLGIRSTIKHRLRRMIFRRRLRYVDRIIVQTKLEKEKLTRKYGLKIPVDVLPPMLPSHLSAKSAGKYNFTGQPVFRVGCLSRYFEHKNLELLYKAAAMLRAENIPAQFILTFRKNEGRRARRLHTRIREDNFDQHIITVGRIPQHRISTFITSVDALILPSLCETYGINCLEAWYHNKPYLISDLDFAHEVCGNAAQYFSPYTTDSVVEVVKKAIAQNAEITSMVSAGQLRLKALSGAKQIIRQFLKNEL